jgi:signal peptidase I
MLMLRRDDVMRTEVIKSRWEWFRKTVWWEYIKTIAFASVLVFGFMRPFVIEAFHIPSGSMEDTLLEGDRILVAKFIYGVKIPFTEYRFLDFHKPVVGDVFVFDPTPASRSEHKLIKRIVGVEGDVIEIRNWEFYRNGERVLYEDYVKRQTHFRGGPRNLGPIKIPAGHVFAMGDNRDLSYDSRYWGFVPVDNIKGQAFFKYWSWDKEADLLHKIRFSEICRLVR